MAHSSIAKCESMERPQGNRLFGGCNDFCHTYKKKGKKILSLVEMTVTFSQQNHSYLQVTYAN